MLILQDQVVIDANLPLNRALNQYPFHRQAEQFFDECDAQGVTFVAPPLFEIESDNAIRLAVLRKLITPAEGVKAFQILDALPIQIIHDPAVRLLARQIADQIGHPRVGDSTYAALAKVRGFEFWTADGAFSRAATGLNWVKFVGNF